MVDMVCVCLHTLMYGPIIKGNVSKVEQQVPVQIILKNDVGGKLLCNIHYKNA